MFSTIVNVFSIKELRDKLLFTLGMLAVYRIGFWIPLPGVNQGVLAEYFERAAAEGNAAGRAAQFVSIFSGGAFGQSTVFGLGIMPYISAAIIFQILGSVLEPLKKLREEGPTGQQKIQEWTRYSTVALCIVQAIGWLIFITSQRMVYATWAHNPIWWVMSVSALTAGTVFLMWLGEQIDRFGIGNGVSLIITAGILTRMPHAIGWVIENFDPGNPQQLGWLQLLMLLGGFVLVVAGSVVITVAQRRIPVQQAKHTRGRRVYGGQRSYLPLKVNHGGVMPIIFASSLMIFPNVILGGLHDQASSARTASPDSWIASDWWYGLTQWLSNSIQVGEFPYVVIYILMVFFFSYFWITVQFNPEEMSKQLRDHGSFIPGLRPGPRTAEYLETVMERVTFVGAAFLAIIAVLPMVVNKSMNIDFSVTQFLGGTGLLIVVNVALDFLQRIEANLLMRNYAGFLGGQDDGRGPRLRG
ncbi:MAG: preprotein translocase subunit SecY [Phycisphaeraceae bacterium]|nr:MAG: preprotein translocase subunit SecY [Phycisphaeraceae bacterium]